MEKEKIKYDKLMDEILRTAGNGPSVPKDG